MDCKLKSLKTRMHSSRMRTGHSLTVSWGGVHPGGVCLGRVSAQGVSAEGGVVYREGDVCPGRPLGTRRRHTPTQTRSRPSPRDQEQNPPLGNRSRNPPGTRSRHLPPPTQDRMTHMCKNITLATTSLRPVKNS